MLALQQRTSDRNAQENGIALWRSSTFGHALTLLIWNGRCVPGIVRKALIAVGLRSVECLVGAELHDGEAERIDLDFAIADCIAEDVGHAGGPAFAL